MADSSTLPPEDGGIGTIIERGLENEMRDAYLDYAMSVIVGRALPDVRDGMKPVHRRVLYAMRLAGNEPGKPYRKSARVVGDVLGRFHPHGQEAVYDTLVRMAQPFTMRAMLVDGQGNFGSVDGDAPAHMRYTEVRLTRIATHMMTDIDKNAVDMMANYDGSEMEPVVLCPSFPALLINGSAGIAVGMATNIPPHNVGETIEGCLLMLHNPEAKLTELLRKIKAPDFPTGAFIHGMKGVHQAYTTGRGSVIMRARALIEPTSRNKKRNSIIVTELPYLVNKARLIEHIALLVREKKLHGLTDLRDESARQGMRIVIDLRSGANANVILNQLFKLTRMQDSFPVNMVALVYGVPRTLDLPTMILRFLDHRREVVYRRTVFELERAREKGHMLEGLAVAVANITEIIALIKGAVSPTEAKTQLIARSWPSGEVEKMLALLTDPNLMRPLRENGNWGLQQAQSDTSRPRYRLSERQAQGILEMRLQRLTAIERDKVITEYENTVKIITDLLDIIACPERIRDIVAAELKQMKKLFGDKRRTEIDIVGQEIADEDLIPRATMVVTLSRAGYIKRTSLSEYRTQHRGGVGKRGADVRSEDFIADLKIADTHDMLLFFTSRGLVYWKKVYQLPEASRTSRGQPIVNFLPMSDDEKIQAMLSLPDLNSEHSYVVMATRNGIVKKTRLSAYARPMKKGIIAIKIDPGDELIDVAITKGTHTILLFTDAGKAVRFAEDKIRATGRVSRGVIGIKLKAKQRVVSAIAVKDDENQKAEVLSVTEMGKGKRTSVNDYPIKNRATQGVFNINRTITTGKVVSCILLDDAKDEVVLITDQGRLIRIRGASVRKLKRMASGVKVFKLGDEKLVGIGRVPKIPETSEDAASLSLDNS